jgi:hypothetical protein
MLLKKLLEIKAGKGCVDNTLSITSLTGNGLATSKATHNNPKKAIRKIFALYFDTY